MELDAPHRGLRDPVVHVVEERNEDGLVEQVVLELPVEASRGRRARLRRAPPPWIRSVSGEAKYARSLPLSE